MLLLACCWHVVFGMLLACRCCCCCYRFNFTIAEGNEGGQFSLGPQSGVLSVVQPLSAGQQSQFLLMIVAQNSEFSCHRGRVNIRIEVLGNVIEFPILDPESVPEDAAIGTEVSRVEALGGGADVIRYTFASGGDGGGVFAINATTGVVTVAFPLDFELLDTYTLTIIGTSDLTGNTGSASLNVTVLDVNENPEFLTPCAQGPPAECMFSVLENQPEDTLVDILAALDPDLPILPNGVITFDLVDLQGTSVGFRLEQVDITAQIFTTESFDREQMPSFMFMVRVSDGGTPPLSSDVMVTVRIDDENDNAPEFVQAPVLLNILETAGDQVITVTQYIAVDADVGINAEISYSLVLESPPLNASAVPFAVDPISGVLTVTGELDFELRGAYIVTILASNPDGLSANATTIFTIVDVNDNAPIFTQEVYTGTVIEGTSSGFPVASILASDADSGLNGLVGYAIDDGDFGGLLRVETRGSLGLVVVGMDIDREMVASFNLTVRASDMGVPVMSDTAVVLVAVEDVNDNPPVFTQEVYVAEIREDSGPKDILNVTAFDADQPQTNNSEIDFALNPATNTGGVFELVAVDGNTATLRLIGQLNFEEQETYELQVTASDRGSTPLTGVATIRVMVTNYNEFPPEVSGNQTIDVSEGDQPGTRIAQVVGMDQDNQQLSFTVTSVMREEGGAMATSDLSLFSVDSSGFVSISRQLDFETTQSYTVVIRVSDGELSALTHITVNVTDVNEFCPTAEGVVFSVVEEQPNGTFVGTVRAADGDSGPGADLTFALVQDTPLASLFAIDPRTGNITTIQVLDREVLGSLFLTSAEQVRVAVADSGVPPCSIIADVGVTLEDINDNAPVFQNVPLLVFVSEGDIGGQFVINAMATDSDEGANSIIEYSVLVTGVMSPPEPLPFTIGDTGVVRAAAGLDAEMTSSYDIIITAFDNGEPSLSASVEVVVSVTDVNDNAPVFSQESYEVSVPESVGSSEVLIEIVATDGDLTQLNSAVSYSIASATPPGSFTIDPETGGVSAIGGLDFETAPTHNLIITARDQGTPQLSAMASLTVSVTNVDEAPPRFLSENCSIGILEEVVQPGSSVPVGVCSAADVDEITGELVFGVPLVYEIISGNIGNAFSISNDGTVILDGLVDREVLDSYFIAVRVSDAAGLSDNAVIHVIVQDINDNAPVVLNAPLTQFVLAEDISTGMSDVVTVEASDEDIGVNGDLVYTLPIVNVASDGMGAELSVVVSDRGLDPLNATVTVSVQFEVPCFVQDYVIGEADGRVIGQYLCSISIEPESLDIAIGQMFFLTCSVLSNLDVVFEFAHNGSAVAGQVGGVLVTNETTFESTGQYLCSAATEIGGLTSMETDVSVQGKGAHRWSSGLIGGGSGMVWGPIGGAVGCGLIGGGSGMVWVPIGGAVGCGLMGGGSGMVREPIGGAVGCGLIGGGSGMVRGPIGGAVGCGLIGGGSGMVREPIGGAVGCGLIGGGSGMVREPIGGAVGCGLIGGGSGMVRGPIGGAVGCGLIGGGSGMVRGPIGGAVGCGLIGGGSGMVWGPIGGAVG